MLQLTYGDKVRVYGQSGFYSVFTHAGYAKKYGEDLEKVMKRARQFGHDTRDRLQQAATVISSDGKGMAAWGGCPVVMIGDLVSVDGRVARVDRESLGRDLVLEYVEND